MIPHQCGSCGRNITSADLTYSMHGNCEQCGWNKIPGEEVKQIPNVIISNRPPSASEMKAGIDKLNEGTFNRIGTNNSKK